MRPGTAAPPDALEGQRVFLDASEGVALATDDNADYPVLSTDGGRLWRIAGPPLHIDAADGPEAVQAVGIDDAQTFFAYGSSVVDVTSDTGRYWWQSLLGEDVIAVTPAPGNTLVALVEQPRTNQAHSPALIFQYTSRDGGRHWHDSTQLQIPASRSTTTDAAAGVVATAWTGSSLNAGSGYLRHARQ